MGPGELTTPRSPGSDSRRACAAAGGYGCEGGVWLKGNGVPGPTCTPGGGAVTYRGGGGREVIGLECSLMLLYRRRLSSGLRGPRSSRSS